MGKKQSKLHFSVIIPLFNKEKYIKRSINSILEQSYPHFEVIVVNDGSTDGGENHLNFYNNSNIRLINQKNSGVSVARNVGVENANYDYVVFLDADDTWEKDFLSELHKLINEFPEADLYGVNQTFHYANNKIISINYSTLFNGQERGIIKDYYKTFAQLGRSPFSNSGCCFRKQIFLGLGGYKPGIRLTEDSDLWCRTAFTSTIAFSIKPLVTYYLETPENTRSLMEFKDYQVSITLQKFLKTPDLPNETLTSLKHLIAFQQLSLVKRAIITGNKKFALSKLMDIRIFSYYPLSFFLIFPFLFLPQTIVLFLLEKKRISK